MNEDEYQEETSTLLQDERTYKKLLRDHFLYERKIMDWSNNQIQKDTDQFFIYLIIYISHCPKFFCSPKTHEQDFSVLWIQSPIKVSSQNFSYGGYDDINVQDPFSFANDIQGITKPKNFELVSLWSIHLGTFHWILWSRSSKTNGKIWKIVPPLHFTDFSNQSILFSKILSTPLTMNIIYKFLVPQWDGI